MHIAILVTNTDRSQFARQNPRDPEMFENLLSLHRPDWEFTVYDLTGRTVATLLTGDQKTAGQHRVSFDARRLASGTYIYRLEATPTAGHGAPFIQSKSMVLLK